ADPSRHGCNSDVVVAMSFERRMILIAGTGYAGEIKKSIFSYLNYTLPELGVMPMHCSANHATGDPNDVAVFFGLSGTGKTTLSADPRRTLIGDDEHGWSDNGTFNMEGGCYAKTLHLDPVTEPDIHAATRKFATVIENMVCDPDTREPDFDDDSITANMRCAYPLEYITSASATGLAGQPRHIVMLTCDAFGVLPPIARLTPAQAVYHFLSGFTSKAAGTERGVVEPQPTFSACFGAPFMPRRPDVYGRLLGKRIASSGASCWLVNTGWTGGAYGEGSRLPIDTTRRLLSLVLDGTLERAAYRKDDKFKFSVPVSVAGVDNVLLRPRDTWPDAAAFDRQTAKLLRMFSANFAKYDSCVGQDVLAEKLVDC
ncbi:MAG: phosphoenolpyruvate carboxykinase (ATP), partial [Rhodobacteraceae bacterium]|nr:phosphoenolpyruvate carboxykinase (ATP) [Paracoccaceae bacterium]